MKVSYVSVQQNVLLKGRWLDGFRGGWNGAESPWKPLYFM